MSKAQTVWRVYSRLVRDISRFQRSVDLSFAHPARWAGLLHSAPLALFGDACK